MTRRKDFDQSTRRKMSEIILEMGAGFVGVGDTGNEQSFGAIFDHLGSATRAVVEPGVSF